jgi:hypothetical protein
MEELQENLVIADANIGRCTLWIAGVDKGLRYIVAHVRMVICCDEGSEVLCQVTATGD